ncbi:hypothetical protein [Nocardioides sp.]|uniref:hypothetical protein n=1 Tax=Nocardioides sp. TaxID=35761 RepID=UPI002631CE95|nr:hypothetical protein [Nocardioides sp.]MCW2735888.1 Sigma-70 region 2 [Nocardioides sp.]
MSLPTDFHREISERAEQPGFDVVLERARGHRRRRRTSLASGVAAAVVVAGLAFAVSGPGDESPDPAPPAPTTPWDGTSEVDPRLPGSVRVILENKRLDLWAVSGSGGVAALWRGCDVEPCTFAVVIRDGDQVVGSTLGASLPRISPVPGGWLYEDTRGISMLNPAGGRDPVYVIDSRATDVMAGDTVVDTSDGPRLLRGTKVIGIPTPSGREAVSAYVTPDGRMVAATGAGGGVLVAATDDGRTWDSALPSHTSEPVSSVMVAGHGDHVAVALLGDAPDGSIPVLEVQVSHDAGRTWTWVRGLDTDGGDRVRDPSSMAVTADGLAFLATASHHVIRIDTDGDALPVQLSSFDASVFELAGTVCAVSERGRYDQLSCSTDGGTSWFGQPLPGLR